jgi:2,3-bisphosphoglycerate-independent phosphoglycerate mutase
MTSSVKRSRPKPITLITIEGLGSAPASEGNLVSRAKTPYFERLAGDYPAGLLSATKESESGHGVIGLGRKQVDIFEMINDSLPKKAFCELNSFKKLIEDLRPARRLHLMGLLSTAEEEASLSQLEILLKEIRRELPDLELVWHIVLDGRVAAPTAGERLLRDLEKNLKQLGNCRLATIIGRFYALDNRYNSIRTEKALRLLIAGEGRLIENPSSAAAESYEKKIFDEEFSPSILGDAKPVEEGETILFWNHSGRAFAALIGALKKAKPSLNLVTLSDYGVGALARNLFSLPEPKASLGSVIANHGLRQLRLADSGAFPGISLWLDGGLSVNEGIDRRLVPISSALPIGEAMVDSIIETRKAFIEAVHNGHYDFIAVGFSQLDVLAHRGLENELIACLEELDNSLRLMMEALERTGGAALITSTHGFVERLIDPSIGTVSKKHSNNPVPLYIIGRRFQGYNLGWPEAVGGDLSMLNPIGTLADIAPTILRLAALTVPKEMTGRNLIK